MNLAIEHGFQTEFPGKLTFGKQSISRLFLSARNMKTGTSLSVLPFAMEFSMAEFPVRDLAFLGTVIAANCGKLQTG